jgi:hypothetical protein
MPLRGRPRGPGVLLRFGLSGVVLVAAAIAPAAVWAQQRLLPPGLEREVARLVFPGDGGAELAAGVRVERARIEATHINVVLGRGRVHLVERGTRTAGIRIGDTPSFTVWLVEGADDPAVREAAEALRRRIEARDPGDFFSHATLQTGSPLGASTRGALWLALLGGLALLALWGRRGGGLPGRSDVAVALVLFGGALALRLLLPPWAPLHSNDHGINELRGLSGAPNGLGASQYGTAYLHFVRACLAPFGQWAHGPLALAAVAGSIAPVLLFALARTLSPRRAFGAIAAGLALAVHPAHVRLSLSETPKPLAGALWLLGLALGAWAFQRAQRRAEREVAFALAAVAWALALELRVLTMLLPWGGLLLVLVAAGRSATRPSWTTALFGAAVVGAIAVLHLNELTGVASEAALRSFRGASIVFALLGKKNVLFDPTLTPFLLVPLVLVGAFQLLRQGEARLVVAAGLAALLLMPPSMLITASRTDAIRYQSEPHFPLLLLLVGLQPLAPLAGRRALAFSVACLGLVATAVCGWLDLREPDVHARAYAIAIEQAPPTPTPIFVASARMRLDERVLSQFPDYAIAAPWRVSTEPAEGCQVWIGVSCWSFTLDEVRADAMGVDAEAGAPFRSECAELLGGVEAVRNSVPRLTAIDVPHRDGEFHRIPAPRPRVGYVPCPTRPAPPR